MLLRTHFVIAVLACLLIGRFYDASFNSISFMFIGFFLLGTFFVDIDSKKSKTGKFFLLRPIQWLFSHRGILHSLLFAFIFGVLIYIFEKTAGIAFFLGYVLHLVLDGLTRQGVMFFWPVFGKKISIFGKFGLKSGGLFEEIIFVLVLLADGYLFFKFFLSSL